MYLLWEEVCFLELIKDKENPWNETIVILISKLIRKLLHDPE